jgi:predicted RNase H-like HicB family nuclease
MEYLIIIEKGENNFGAYAPDVPGCGATGATPDEAKENMIKALKMHFKGLSEDGLPIPMPTTKADYADLA